MLDDDFILDVDESRTTPPRELTGWEAVIFEIVNEETEHRGPTTED
ncbi:MAG TPA: hypothetical protein VGK31_14935 [Thermoanaerobaculia bacterium]|jgi:hypothetical protein